MPDKDKKHHADHDSDGGANADHAGGRAEQLSAKAADAMHQIKVASSGLVERVRELIDEGNVRRIAIKRGDRTLLEIPLTVGVGAGAAAVFFTPILAAVGALAALVSEIDLVVEREDGANAEGSKGANAEGSKGASGGAASGGAESGPGKTVGRSGDAGD